MSARPTHRRSSGRLRPAARLPRLVLPSAGWRVVRSARVLARARFSASTGLGQSSRRRHRYGRRSPVRAIGSRSSRPPRAATTLTRTTPRSRRSQGGPAAGRRLSFRQSERLGRNAAGGLRGRPRRARPDGATLPLVADLEFDPYTALDHTNECYGLTPAQLVSWIRAFVREVDRRTGQPPAIYTVSDWWDTCTASSAAFAADPLWIADYAPAHADPAAAGRVERLRVLAVHQRRQGARASPPARISARSSRPLSR